MRSQATRVAGSQLTLGEQTMPKDHVPLRRPNEIAGRPGQGREIVGQFVHTGESSSLRQGRRRIGTEITWAHQHVCALARILLLARTSLHNAHYAQLLSIGRAPAGYCGCLLAS